MHLSAGSFEDDIDEDLVPTLRQIWHFGIETVSCQNAGNSYGRLALQAAPRGPAM